MNRPLVPIVFFVFLSSATSVSSQTDHLEYQNIKTRLASGWNTWDNRSVLTQVLLPECLALKIAFKQHYWLDESYLPEALIGRRGEDAEKITPGPHAIDGSYSRLQIRWEQLHARIETATQGDDLVILLTPLQEPQSAVKMIVQAAMLWNNPGILAKNDLALKANLPSRDVRIFTTGTHVPDPYVEAHTPYLVLPVDGPIGISTGKPRGLKGIQEIIHAGENRMLEKAGKFGDLQETYIALESGIAWNTIFEPKFQRVVSTVGRLWNLEYGGYCLFGWDNFFLAYVSSLWSRDRAFANIFEHLAGKTEEGFIPNDNRGNGSKSWDRSQPPVGSIMVKEIYKRHPEKWFLEETFDDLLGWNRWWLEKRVNQGLLSYGSHEAKNPFNEPNRRTKKTAGYESGMDDSPMYEGVPFNRQKNTLELQDVALNCLVIADSRALAEIANLLGRQEERLELIARANRLAEQMESLWSEEIGLFLNRRTDTGELSTRLSPTMFYPLLAEIATPSQAGRMMSDHFFNQAEFWGEFVLPSIARNDPAFPKQRYWKGAIWPPLNFLTYLGLRKNNLGNAATELSQRSQRLFLQEWRRQGYVSENYSAITGTGDDERLSSDRFHSWGTLMGIMSLIEAGHMPPPEDRIKTPH